MVGDEVDCRLVILDYLFGSIMVDVIKGPNDAISTESLVHVRFHGTMQGVADSVKLVIYVKERLYNMIAEEDKSNCKDHYPIRESK